MIRDILYIEGEPMDMAEGAKVTLTFQSPILTDISKQAANYSQTINLPRTARNEALLGLPLSLTAQSFVTAFRYKRKPGRLERNGITIAEGEVYLLDSSTDSISVCFIFGRIKALERLKEHEGNINSLSTVETMQARTWKNTADTSKSFTRFVFPKYNTGATEAEMVATKVGYYGAVSINSVILTGISYLCGGIAKSEQANNVLKDLWLMARSANDSDYTASLTPTTLTPTGGGDLKAEYNRGTVGAGPDIPVAYTFAPAFNGATVAAGKYGEVALLKVGAFTQLTYKVAAEQKLTIATSGNLQLQWESLAKYNAAQIARTKIVYYIRPEDDEESEKLQKIEGTAKVTSFTYTQSGGIYTNIVSIENASQVLELDKGQVLLIAIDIPMASRKFETSPIGNAKVLSGSFILTSSGLKEPIIVAGAIPYHPAGNLPELKPIDLLKSLCTMLGLYIAPDKTTGGLYIATLNEVIDNLAEADDWTERLVVPDKSKNGRLILNHYFSVGDYKAQRNVIKFKDDSNDPDAEKIDESARNIVLACDNEGLEREKTIATLPFAATYGDNMRHYTYKPADNADEEPEIERKELQPRIVRIMLINGVAVATSSGLYGRDLQGVNLRGLQSLIKQPHRIKVNMRLTTWDIKTLNLERPIYLAQFGCYFLIEQVQTTSTDIAEVTLLKIN